ncbi:uncharacterized protein K452DRAFT_275341 [Aplosporella prunicola CBS 121167]|uniref:FAD/NAD(P)-binding domain-containing protein n=1 Tax=Aplosporella prunicola CBS 121167 TaxID=1176127 RepID=A0A6A6B5U0_9PEZI|nr:uncharacterized protein K452DRAFT_275341 [Aplosporella prunicola CBS 121167]KAF2139226.1 hypothetical protein K452DRAFT_275341 [Aplosporella prunicola CBS 121167]
MVTKKAGLPNGTSHNNSSQKETGSADTSVPLESHPNWVSLLEQPLHTPRPLKIICVGAGYSGLTLAHKIKHEHKLSDILDLTIYEKNSDVGGTWFENRYPGVACDVPAHCYTFLFEPNPDWSHFYASGPEIQAYIKRTVRKWDLDERVQFNSKIVEAVWNEDAGKWRIKVDQAGTVKEDEADILINGAGFLNKASWPRIEGLDDFRGKIMHTAEWDTSYDWHGKRVAVIGNGSSGIQCVAAMQPKVSRLVNYVRNPTWISINFLADDAQNGKNYAYSEEQKKRFREDHDYHFAYRRNLEANVNKFYFGMLTGHPAQTALQAASKSQMQERIDKLQHAHFKPEELIPQFKPGCRRLTPGDGYIEAFDAPNCSMNRNAISRVTPRGILTANGVEEAFDMIVCATGFDTNFVPSWKLVGRDGATLEERWKTDPQAFFAVQVDSMPNFFMFNGPNCPISHGSVLTQIMWTCDYILRWARKIATEDIKSVEPLPAAVRDYNVWAQEFLKRTTWADECRSWYKNGKHIGWVTGPYPGSILHFKECLDHMGGEHFDVRYRSKNRFRGLGNGLTKIEGNGEGDTAWYMEETRLKYKL